MTKAALALGIDIGATHTKIGLVNAAGEISAFRRIPTDARGSDPAPYLANLVTQVREILANTTQEVIGIGVSTVGHIDHRLGGPILCSNAPALKGVNLCGLLAENFNRPVILNNDGIAHALAEYTYGSGNGARRFLCLALGTGLGAGVIINGEPMRHIDGTTGDLGRIILEVDGPVDVYGVRGSAESFCGVLGIERLASQRYGRAIKAHEVIQAAREGNDPVATAVMQQVGAYVGHTLAILSPIFMPDRIALTGGTTEAGDVLLNACRQRFNALMGDYHRTLANLAGDYYSEVEIVMGRMRGETGIVGAVIELLRP